MEYPEGVSPELLAEAQAMAKAAADRVAAAIANGPDYAIADIDGRAVAVTRAKGATEWEPIVTEADRALARLSNDREPDLMAEARFLHSALREFDWYLIARSDAERRLHERLTRLVSSEEFGDLCKDRG